MGEDFGNNLEQFSGSIHSMNSNGMTGLIWSRMNGEDDNSNAGRKAVFLLNKRSSQEQSTCGKAHSKKRHMQQPSDQLFIEEAKGVEQMPACRDIVFFVLFFVFHLLLNVNLSRNDIQ